MEINDVYSTDKSLIHSFVKAHNKTLSLFCLLSDYNNHLTTSSLITAYLASTNLTKAYLAVVACENG